VDGLTSDRLGRLALTHEGLGERDRTIFEFVRQRALPVVVTLGGGYSEPIDDTVVAHANTFRLAGFGLQPFPRVERLFK
jgi:acetoin utilization deacetylase AcuC-like enzyme